MRVSNKIVLKVFIPICFVLFPIFKLTAQTEQDNNSDFPANPLGKKGWVLTMHDEFNGPELNRNLWIPYYFRHRYANDTNAKASYEFQNGCISLKIEKNTNRVSSIQTFERANLILPGTREIPTKILFTQKYG